MRIKQYIFTLSFLLLTFGNISLAESTTKSVDTGPRVYGFACKNCHAPQVATGIGAPAAFDQQAWQERITQAEKEIAANPQKYADVYAYFLEHVKRGKGLMAHGGLCFDTDIKNKDCSDQALLAAMQYMMTTPSALKTLNKNRAVTIQFQVIQDNLQLYAGDFKIINIEKKADDHYAIQLQFNKSVAGKLNDLTKENIGKEIQFVLGHKIINSAVIHSNLGDKFEIDGLNVKDKEYFEKFSKG